MMSLITMLMTVMMKLLKIMKLTIGMTFVHICIFDLFGPFYQIQKNCIHGPNHKESMGQVFVVMSMEGQVW